MKAMILAAGRGKRMGALTDNCPKPLVKVGSLTLIEWQIQRLRDNGFSELVINVGYLGERIVQFLGDGCRYGVSIEYSIEPPEGLETGGGVFHALPLLGEEPFVLTNADVFCEYPYKRLLDVCPQQFHAVLVENPSFKTVGDFSLENGVLQRGGSYTFAGISVVNPTLFRDCRAGFYPIAPLFHRAIAESQASAEVFSGAWYDVGTPERLEHVIAYCTN